LGKFCSIGNGVKILCGGEHRTDTVSTYPLRTLLTIADGDNYDATTKGPTMIGNDVWIGAGALILSGVKVGDGAVIGSGSVVASDIPPYAVAYGNPAKVKRSRFSSSQIEKLLRIAWWDWDDDTIKARESDFYGNIEIFLARYDKKG
jgi:acetyltransferase-like isoleucine patch superfamily enzyme